MSADEQFADAELTAAIWDAGGAGVYAHLPAGVRLVHAVAHRLGSASAELADQLVRGPLVMLFGVERIDVPDARFPHEYFGWNGVGQLSAARVWVCNEEITYARGSSDGLDDPVAFVRDDSVLGDMPAVVLSAHDERVAIWHFPAGLASPADSHEVEAYATSVSPSTVEAIIDDVYQRYIATPRDQPKGTALWEKARKGWASQFAEGRIQHALEIALGIKLGRLEVRKERPTKAGDCDLVVQYRDDNLKLYRELAAIELKVTRQYGETGRLYSAKECNEILVDGARQAQSYWSETPTDWGALYVFDMRQSVLQHDDLFAPVVAATEFDGLCLRHWHVFRTAKAWRERPKS